MTCKALYSGRVFRRCGLAGALAVLLSVTAIAAEISLIELRLSEGDVAVTFAIPAHCIVQNGPGTAEAICDPDASAPTEASQVASSVAALYFEVTLDQARDAGGASAVSLAQSYAFADFQKELPGAVCGEERVSRIRIENPQRQMENGRIVYSAIVTCPEVRFLGLGPRRAVVRYIFSNATRLTTIARALTEDFERSKPMIDAFHASVALQPERKP